jgi:hypothetical protein
VGEHAGPSNGQDNGICHSKYQERGTVLWLTRAQYSMSEGGFVWIEREDEWNLDLHGVCFLYLYTNVNNAAVPNTGANTGRS